MADEIAQATRMLLKRLVAVVKDEQDVHRLAVAAMTYGYIQSGLGGSGLLEESAGAWDAIYDRIHAELEIGSPTIDGLSALTSALVEIGKRPMRPSTYGAEPIIPTSAPTEPSD